MTRATSVSPGPAPTTHKAVLPDHHVRLEENPWDRQRTNSLRANKEKATVNAGFMNFGHVLRKGNKLRAHELAVGPPGGTSMKNTEQSRRLSRAQGS